VEETDVETAEDYTGDVDGRGIAVKA